MASFIQQNQTNSWKMKILSVDAGAGLLGVDDEDLPGGADGEGDLPTSMYDEGDLPGGADGGGDLPRGVYDEGDLPVGADGGGGLPGGV